MNSGIYKITHKDTGRVYIGQSTNLSNRLRTYRNSGGSGNGNSIIKRAILKHGWDAFNWEIVLYADNFDYLNDIEVKLIKFYDCLAPNGFNVEVGGLNSKKSDRVKKAVSEANRKRIITDEIRAKMSNSHKQRWANMSAEELDKYKEYGRLRNLGKTMPEESKQKMKIAALKRWQNPEYRTRVLEGKGISCI